MSDNVERFETDIHTECHLYEHPGDRVCIAYSVTEQEDGDL